MTDLAPRPRGGWQVGARLSRPQGSAGAVADPAPDCCTVARPRPGEFLVRHFPRATAKKPCCAATIAVRPGESEVDALARADRLFQSRHIRPGVVAEWSEDEP